MDKGKSQLATTLLAAAALTVTAASAQAVVYVEPGNDAGQTLATAANTGLAVGTGGTLTGISGTIGTSADADLYKFTANSTVTLVFTANGGTSSLGNFAIDTSIFLFDTAGNPLVANDDQSNTNYQGSFTFTLAAGTYYLGISLSGNEPINSNSQLLFTVNQPTTARRGAASGLNPTTLSTFNGNTSVAETGPYSISINAVPEPSTTAALAFGGLASLVFLRRLRRPRLA